MNGKIFLLNVNIAGVKSIKNEVRLNFYKKTIDSKFEPNNYRIKSIYGENGSGKSAIITAIKIFQDIIADGRYLKDTKNQELLNELINKETRKFVFSCEYLVDFSDGKKVYYYSIELGKSIDEQYEIKHELLKVKNGNYSNYKYITIFETKNGEVTNVNCDDTEDLEKKMMNLLLGNSFVYLYLVKLQADNAKKTNILIHISNFLLFVFKINVYLADDDKHELFLLKKILYENKIEVDDDFKLFIEDTKKIFSVNEKIIPKEKIEAYRNRVEQLTRFIKIFKKELVSIDIETKEDEKFYRCELIMNYGSYSINNEFESTGIKKMISIFDFFSAVTEGGIVFIDEMDANINPIYLNKIIEYFMYYGKGQLCFTTHNIEPMTVLKEKKNSIEFLSSDNHLYSWTSNGNASPENFYKNGMIEDLPMNIEATDFIGIL